VKQEIIASPSGKFLTSAMAGLVPATPSFRYNMVDQRVIEIFSLWIHSRRLLFNGHSGTS
jgi:hypothetical protein